MYEEIVCCFDMFWIDLVKVCMLSLDGVFFFGKGMLRNRESFL